jgi:hypothetical protein
MRVLIRVILLMLGRAVAFIRANPDENPGSAQVAARLVALGERAEILARQQRAGQMGVSAASNDKAERREELQTGVRAVIEIARVASKDNPDLTVHRRPLRRRVDETTLLTTARVVVAEAGAAMEVMAQYGLTRELLDSITANVEAYEAALTRQRNALAAQVGAGAELDAVAAAIMDVVKNLDALYRVRFRKDPERLAAWKSARNVAWPGSATEEEPASPAPAAPDSGKAA